VTYFAFRFHRASRIKDSKRRPKRFTEGSRAAGACTGRRRGTGRRREGGGAAARASEVRQNGSLVGASKRLFYCTGCKNGYRSCLRLEIATGCKLKSFYLLI
jgi:hypothetical protein